LGRTFSGILGGAWRICMTFIACIIVNGASYFISTLAHYLTGSLYIDNWGAWVLPICLKAKIGNLKFMRTLSLCDEPYISACGCASCCCPGNCTPVPTL